MVANRPVHLHHVPDLAQVGRIVGHLFEHAFLMDAGGLRAAADQGIQRAHQHMMRRRDRVGHLVDDDVLEPFTDNLFHRRFVGTCSIQSKRSGRGSSKFSGFFPVYVILKILRLHADPTPVLLMVRELGIGGCERDLTKIAKGLDRGLFEPHVGCFHSEGLRANELRAAGIPIVRFPVTSFLSRSAIDGARQMGRYMRLHGIQLIHAFDTPTDVFGVPAGKLYRTPVVIASHLSHRDLAPRLHRMVLPLVDMLADMSVVNSKAVQEHLIRDLRIPGQRTYLCYNGVETQVFFPEAGKTARCRRCFAGDRLPMRSTHGKA